MNLHQYDIVIINSSAGKDSLVMLYKIYLLALEQDYPLDQIHVSHQDLGDMEWEGTINLARYQAEYFSFHFDISKRRNKDGYEENLLEYVERRGKWPSNKQRYCTSDFKRGPGARVVTQLTKNLGKCKVLHCFGFWANESPARSKRLKVSTNGSLSTQKRTVHDYLPIHDWTDQQVWGAIRENKLPYHYAYDLGMPRLSCVLCIFSPFDALVLAGKKNPKLLQRYVDVEAKIGHTFNQKFAIADVKKAIDNGQQPGHINDWRM